MDSGSASTPFERVASGEMSCPNRFLRGPLASESDRESADEEPDVDEDEAEDGQVMEGGSGDFNSF